MSHGSRHIQLTLLIRMQKYGGLIHITLDPGHSVCGHGDSAKRAVAADLKRQNILSSFHHAAHHGPGRHQPSQRRRGHRTRIMGLPGLFHHIPCGSGKRPDLALASHCPDNIISHIPLSYLFPRSLAIT